MKALHYLNFYHKGVSNKSDEEALQRDLNRIHTWADSNNQQFNDKKFEAITFSLNKREKTYVTPSDEPINNKVTIQDLGIVFSEDGSFDVHITTLITKGKKLSGWILRTFSCREKTPMVTLLKSLLIPSIEYCCPLWAPTDQANIIRLEKVQRAFTKQILGLHTMQYWDRLQYLNIFSLERRRERYIIIYIWKVLHGLFPNPGFNIHHIDRDDGVALSIPPVKGPTALKKLKERNILCHGVRLFNTLPTYLRKLSINDEQQPSPDSFKRCLDKYLHILPDEPFCPKRPRRAVSNSIIDQKHFKM